MRITVVEVLQEKAFREAVQKLRGYLCEYYKDWYKETTLDPYDLFNSEVWHSSFRS